MIRSYIFNNLNLTGNVFPSENREISSSRSKNAIFTSPYNPDNIVLHKVTGCFNCVIQFAAKACLKYFNKGLNLQEDKWIKIKVIGKTELIAFIDSLKKTFDSEELRNIFQFAYINSNSTKFEIRAYYRPGNLKFNDNQKLDLEYKVQIILCEVDFSTPFSVEGRSGQINYVTIGTMQLKVNVPYEYLEIQALKQVNIYAIMTSAAIKLQRPSKDVVLFLEYFVNNWHDTLIKTFTNHPIINIVPTISLVGENDQTVNEIGQFLVEVFHLDRINKQALVVAFNIIPGISGSKNKLQHFIGDEDYGVISDEYLIDKIFLNKWNNGGFKRQIGWSVPTQVQIQYDNGSTGMVDADVYGTSVINTMDGVSIETNSNSPDCVMIFGNGSVIPSYIMVHFPDGDQYVDAASAGIDVGSTSNLPYALYTLPKIEVVSSGDSELDAFVEQAYKDAYQFVYLPFLINLKINPIYVRTEAISKQLFILGTFQMS